MSAAGNVTCDFSMFSANDTSLPLYHVKMHPLMFAVTRYFASICAVPCSAETVCENADLHLHTWSALCCCLLLEYDTAQRFDRLWTDSYAIT